MKKHKKYFYGLLALVSLLIFIPFLIPTKNAKTYAESLASDVIGVPVTIGVLNIYFLPTPRVDLQQIVVGNEAIVTAESLIVIPKLWSLFTQTKTIDVKVEKPVVKKMALGILTALINKESAEQSTVTVNIAHIKVSALQLIWPNLTLPMLDARIDLTPENQLASASLATLATKMQTGKVTVEIAPIKTETEGAEPSKTLSVVVEADDWTLPIGLPLLIDDARFEGSFDAGVLTFNTMNIALYDGKVTGSARLAIGASKPAKPWQLNGRFNIENVAVKQPSQLLNKTLYLTGDLSGKGSFSSQAKTPDLLTDYLKSDVNFNVKKGVLHGLDLVKIASLFVKQDKQGGETAFETFSGILSARGSNYHVHDLNISSGLISADGAVKMNQNHQLDGLVNVAIKRSLSLVAIPLAVGGTLQSPLVYPSKAALAGAAAGTAILGPGVGTSLGIKAGGAVDTVKGWFGGD